ncbi:putative metal-dependent peptidase [Geothermobacter ehrlichii]|uniref:Putative metal-dependent peptidase n=1 Tax=Geothermobacter ehrlichii TaxID=213224 RepID=A0A5D3WJQ2_9BACT|nr:VWA-like domain-containing protein [Geothermobacter ehrlichii]TYO96108.1 putative metal-dependent peptidase [Geothermobacter ehrlichii]
MEILQNAIIRLLKRAPFYGHLLLGCDRRLVSGEALGITLRGGTPVLVCGEDSLPRFGLKQQEALLEHLVRHLLHLHPVRGRGCHPQVWDLACDLAINPDIDHLPDSVVLPRTWDLPDGLAAEEYALLLRRRFGLGSQRGEGAGDERRAARGRTDAGDGAASAELAQAADERARLDDHRIWSEADGTPRRLAEEVVRQLVRDAHRKSDGEVPDSLATLVEGFLAPPAIPWRDVLRQFVATAGRIGRKSTWKRENRRFAHVTPGQRKRRRLNLLIGVDVSDSTMKPELREAFARELLRIARASDSRLTVLYSGSRIQRIRSFNSSQAVLEVYHGGGFTDLRPVFEYGRTMQPPPAAVIYLTDGYGEAPESMDFPTLWVLTADGRRPADWGVELRLEP